MPGSPSRPIAPPLDAEKATSEQIRENYRTPPDIEPTITRSTLIVGGRGSGKTMLLRFHRHTHDGLALYGDLFKILAPIAADTGAGGLTTDFPPATAGQMASKTYALLAQWIAEQAYANDVLVDLKTLQAVLPPELRLRISARTKHDSFLQHSYTRISLEPLSGFSAIPKPDSLYPLFQSLGNVADAQVLLLLDRAELVTRPSLHAVLHLLDQSSPQTLLLATRPGLFFIRDFPVSPVSGDHFHMRHLGSSPYEPESQTFMKGLLRTWLPSIVDDIEPDHLSWIAALSRDSVRTALELTYNSLADDDSVSIGATRDQLKLVQKDLLQACHGELAEYHSDVLGFVGRMRALRQPPMRPVIITMKMDALRENPRAIQFLDMALRVGLLAMPPGTTWHPTVIPRSVEMPPIFLWTKGDPLWTIK